MHEQNREFPLCNQDPRVAGQQGGNSRRCWSSGPWSGRASKTNGKKNWVFFSSFAGGAYGIEILSDATAAESLGFVKNQTAGVFGAFTADDVFGGDLDLVATNEAPIATASGTSLVTTQGTGEYPASAVGGLDISSTQY